MKQHWQSVLLMHFCMACTGVWPYEFQQNLTYFCFACRAAWVNLWPGSRQRRPPSFILTLSYKEEILINHDEERQEQHQKWTFSVFQQLGSYMTSGLLQYGRTGYAVISAMRATFTNVVVLTQRQPKIAVRKKRLSWVEFF